MRLRVSCRMRGRGQTVPSSRAPVHTPSHTPPCPPLVCPLQPPPLCPPHSMCPFGCVQRALGVKGVCMQPTTLPRRAVPPSARPSRWCAPSALSLAPPPLPALPLVRHPSPPSLAPPLSVCPVGRVQRVG